MVASTSTISMHTKEMQAREIRKKTLERKKHDSHLLSTYQVNHTNLLLLEVIRLLQLTQLDRKKQAERTPTFLI